MDFEVAGMQQYQFKLRRQPGKTNQADISCGKPLFTSERNSIAGRVLARTPNLAVQNMFVGVVSYLCGRGRTKTCGLGRCRNFLFYGVAL